MINGTNPALISLVIAPEAPDVALGQSVQFRTTGKFSDGDSDVNMTYWTVWTSSDPSIASLDSSGLATTHSTGTVRITASCGQRSASAILAVSKAVLVSIAVTPSDSSIPLGDSVQLTATGTFSDQSTQDLTSAVTWASSQPAVAAISSSGLAVSHSVGASAITATLRSVSASSQLTVSAAALVSLAVSANHSTIPLGTTAQFAAEGVYTDQSTQDLTSAVTWTSSQPAVAAISSSGLAVSHSVGASAITATLRSVSASSQLTVSAAALVSLAVSANHFTIPLGTTAQFAAKGVYTDQSTQDLTDAVTWTSSSSGILNINSSGLATGKAVGAATVSAKSGSVIGTAALTVSAPVLVSIAVIAPNQVMPLGTRQQLTATGTLTDGTTSNLTDSAIWSSGSASIVSIIGNGLAAANALGHTTISASMSAVSGSTALTVSSPILVSISISPANPTVPLAASQQLVATGLYSDGSTKDVTQSSTWNVDNPAIATISGMGVATAEQVGATGIESSIGSVVGSATLTVEPLAAVGYFTQPAPNTDAAIRVTNTGSTGQSLCAMVYIFDQDQQMAGCCGCVISPDGLRTFSLSKDFLGNPLTGISSTAGSVMIVPADYSSNPSCDAASSTPSGIPAAWMTSLQNLPNNQSATTEEPLARTPLGPTLSSSLQAQCGFVQQLGAGHGICGCGTGD